MKPNLTLFLTFFSITIFSFQLKGQEAGTISTGSFETILKLENPYSENRTKWLNRNGFKTDTYNWNDPAINLYLDRAVKNRSTGNAFGFIGGAALFIGVLINIQAGVVRSSGNSVESKSTINPFYLIGGTFVVTSIGLKMDAHNQLRNAKEIRAKNEPRN